MQLLFSQLNIEVQLQTNGSVRAKGRESSSDGDGCLQAHLFYRYMGDAIYTEVPLNERHPPGIRAPQRGAPPASVFVRFFPQYLFFICQNFFICSRSEARLLRQYFVLLY